MKRLFSIFTQPNATVSQQQLNSCNSFHILEHTYVPRRPHFHGFVFVFLCHSPDENKRHDRAIGCGRPEFESEANNSQYTIQILLYC